MLEFPNARQAFNYDCGAAVLEALLTYYGLNAREDNLIKKAGTTRKGTSVKGMIGVIKSYGLKCEARKMSISEIKKFIARKIPVILVLQAWTKKKDVQWKTNWKDGHYVVAVGYNRKKIYFEDPASFKRTYLGFNELKQRWHDIDDQGRKYINYGIAVSGLKPVYRSKAVEHMD